MSNPYTNENGGPAFPISIPGCGDNGAGGMTLRDYFAAKALQALIAQWSANGGAILSAPYQLASQVAYGYADAMVKERAA